MSGEITCSVRIWQRPHSRSAAATPWGRGDRGDRLREIALGTSPAISPAARVSRVWWICSRSPSTGEASGSSWSSSNIAPRAPKVGSAEGKPWDFFSTPWLSPVSHDYFLVFFAVKARPRSAASAEYDSGRYGRWA